MKTPFTKSILLTILALVSSYMVYAQESQINSSERNLYTGFYTFAGIGPAIPIGGFGENRTPGFDLNTAISINYESGFMIRGNFDFSAFTFDRGEITQNINGQSFDIEGDNNLVTFNLGPGYHFKSSNRLAPYFYSGLGFSILTNPVLEFDNTNNVVTVTRDSNLDFSVVGGGGLDYIVNYGSRNSDHWKPFLFYFESFFTYIPGQVEISPSTFFLLSFNVGIKANI